MLHFMNNKEELIISIFSNIFGLRYVKIQTLKTGLVSSNN